MGRAVATASDLHGTLDVLVNNAGILKFRRIADMAVEEFDRVINVNLRGTWLGVKSVIAPMRAAGRGSIVNISSIEGFVGAEGMSAYSASKFAIRGVTKSAALDSLLGQRHIYCGARFPQPGRSRPRCW